MFRIPQPKNEMIEGQDDTRLVVLHGISKDEFECLLKALLCRQRGQNKSLVLHFTSQWISVLKLSTMWECTSLRAAAISWLDSNSWLLPSLLALAQRHNPISVEEGRHLGIETALKLASVREGLRLERLDPTATRLDFTPMIQKVFEL
ncbi:hypothetical protein F5J12DRAFT_851105 [Pisolithus orientalis]|uniref:uncharacterized protein n=1 Tax=Pisolithus orientalis TaxID=936130 RepID=UPI002224DF43|nr:uncharacterized protein F5J12DRAFT_851105 [Pisolithus orientalis]KAI5997663.1 hypothetical protein F5J12DRAFT_851105 [Pisolithus orientalis]